MENPSGGQDKKHTRKEPEQKPLACSPNTVKGHFLAIGTRDYDVLLRATTDDQRQGNQTSGFLHIVRRKGDTTVTAVPKATGLNTGYPINLTAGCTTAEGGLQRPCGPAILGGEVPVNSRQEHEADSFL